MRRIPSLFRNREKLPLLTVITPTYNRAGWLEETIESVFAQDYPRLEYLVFDDGSSDDTPALLRRLQKQYGSHLHPLRHRNIGQARTINRGFAMAKGELICLVSSDDPLPRGCLRPVIDALRIAPEIVLAYPDIVYVDSQGSPIAHLSKPEYSFVDMVRWHECIPSAGAVFRRWVVDKVGGWDPTYRTMPDFEFFLRIGLLGPFRRVPGVAAAWRQHKDSITSRERGDRMAREHIRAIETFFARNDIPRTVRAVRSEAMRMAYYAAGVVVDDAVNPAHERFHITDRLSELSGSVHESVAPGETPDSIISWLHREVAKRDTTIAWLHQEVANRDATIAALQQELIVRENDGT